MATRMSVILGGAISMILMVVALRAWSQATNWSASASRPDVATLAIRSGAIALIAIAQGVALIWVVGKMYQRNLADDLLKLLAVSVTAVALVAAVALGLASK